MFFIFIAAVMVKFDAKGVTTVKGLITLKTIGHALFFNALIFLTYLLQLNLYINLLQEPRRVFVYTSLFFFCLPGT
jgi:hypothetical protein